MSDSTPSPCENIFQPTNDPPGESEASDPRFLPDDALVPVRPREDGWTPEKQRAFIEHLADGRSANEAAAMVGMTGQSAFRLRRRADAAAFAQAWDAALRHHGQFYYQTAWDRGVNGVAVPRYHRGEQIGERRVYSDRMLIYLMERHDRLEARAAGRQVVENWESAMEALASGTTDLPSGNYVEKVEKESYGLWREADGTPYTNFPPPDGFDGEERGRFGDFGYRRTLTAAENAMVTRGIRAHDALKRADAEAERDEFFGFAKKAARKRK